LPSLFELYDDVFDGRHRELERRLSLHGDEPLLDNLLEALRDRYQEIAAIPCVGYYSKLDVVRGCTSKFHPRDIRFFLEVTDPLLDPSVAATSRVEEDWRRLRIYRSLGYAFEWRLSPETMGIIEKRLHLPEWSRAADGFKSSTVMEADADWEW
jgi:hypothetical protein